MKNLGQASVVSAKLENISVYSLSIKVHGNFDKIMGTLAQTLWTHGTIATCQVKL